MQSELQTSSLASSSILSSLSSLSHYSSNPISKIIYTFVFFIGASLHGLSTLYKERCVMRWSIHIDNLQLSSQLFFYQFITAIVLAFLYYSIQGMNLSFIYLCFIYFYFPFKPYFIFFYIFFMPYYFYSIIRVWYS
jgi:hypothetical protein